MEESILSKKSIFKSFSNSYNENSFYSFIILGSSKTGKSTFISNILVIKTFEKNILIFIFKRIVILKIMIT